MTDSGTSSKLQMLLPELSVPDFGTPGAQRHRLLSQANAPGDSVAEWAAFLRLAVILLNVLNKTA